MPVKKKSRRVQPRSLSGPQSTPSRRIRITPFHYLLIVPLLVLWPVVFGGYTLSQNPNAVDTRTGYGGFYDPVTLMDPGGNLLDEPSLALVARNLAHGRLPLLNMENGMGALQVESLLTGTLYVLNPVLLLLPTDKPLYFDVFIIIHVYIFLIGAYVLLRRYASPAPAAAVSILLVFSGVTFLHWNAIHYRSVVWTPWMMAGLVGILRGERIRRHWLMLLGAVIACGTAGNVQEFAMDVGAVCVVGGCEWASLEGRRRWRTLLIAGGGLLCGFVIASIAFLPFFAARAEGWIFIATSADRSTQRYEPAFLASWLIPKVIGPYVGMFLRDVYYHPHPDYSLTGCLFLALGAVCGWAGWRSGARHTAWICLAPIAVIVLGLLKIVHFRIFDFVAAIPLLRDLWFVKYHSYLFLLAAIPSAVGLERALTADRTESRSLIRIAIAMTCMALGLAMLYLWQKVNYVTAWGSADPMVREVFQKWIVTGAVFICVSALLYFRPRFKCFLLLALVTVQCAVLFPRGNGQRKPAYVSGLNYAGLTTPAQRLLVSDTANSNVLIDRESLAVTDAALNRSFRDFLLAFFVAMNAGTMLQPHLSPPLTDTQALTLRLAGVTAVYGYPEDSRYIEEGRVANPAPRAFLVSRATFDALHSATIRPNNVAEVIRRLEADWTTLPQPGGIRVIDESVQMELPARKENTVLVINQAYSPNWSLNGRAPSMMADLWPAWELGAGEGAKVAAVYWPRGLTLGMEVSAAGAAAALAFYWLVVRKENAT